METCWFCKTNQATHQFKVFLYKSTLTKVTALEKTFSTSNITVGIQRCDVCANIHQFREKRKKLYFVTFMLNILLFFLLVIVFGKQIGSIIDITVEKLNKVVSFILLMVVSFLPTIIVLSIGVLRREKDEIKKWPQMEYIDIKSYSNSVLSKNPKVSMYIKLGYTIVNDNLKRNLK